MFKYVVIVGNEVVYSTDRPKDAHYVARIKGRERGLPAIVLKTVCKWQIEMVRTNA